MRSTIMTTGASALAMAAALCAVASGAAAQEAIRGQGATLPAGLYADWFNPSPVSNFTFSYNAARAGTAALTGSGAGKNSFTSHSFNNARTDFDVQYAGSDAILTSTDIANYDASVGGAASTRARWGDAIQLPSVGTPVTIAYNQGSLNLSRQGATGVVASDGSQSSGSALFLSRASYCGIFTGGITNWNDSRLRADNNNVSPAGNQPIRVVVRADSSGTTEIFTRHLDTVCDGSAAAGGFSFPDTRRAADQSNAAVSPPGRTGGTTDTLSDNFINWDAIITPASRLIRASGSAGVSQAVASNAYSIGYVSPDYTNLVSPAAPGTGSPAPATALLQNQNDINNSRANFGKSAAYINVEAAQSSIVAPSNTDTALQWGQKLNLRQGGTTPTATDERNNPTGRNAYPINGFTFLNFYTCYPSEKRTGVRSFIINYIAAGSGDDKAKAAGFAPLGATLKDALRARAQGSGTSPRGIVIGPISGYCTL